MKNNSLLTYVLYGLLGLILIIAGYYACQKQKDTKLKKEQDEAELQQTLKDMGYAQNDTTTTGGSSFVERDTNKARTTAKPTVNKDGIEVDPAGTKPVVTTQPGTKKPTTAVTTTPAKPVVKKTTSKGIAGPGSGRWAVRAGTFAYMEGARRRLEEVIKAGYPNAEISKTADGKAAVVVFRSNDKNAAIRVVDKLEEKNIDAAVFDRQK
jgi:cytoskeletal protein RodZ